MHMIVHVRTCSSLLVIVCVILDHKLLDSVNTVHITPCSLIQ